MDDTVAVECVDLALNWQVLFDPGLGSVEVQLRAKGLQPVVGFLLILGGSVIGYSVLDNGESSFSQIVFPACAFFLGPSLSCQQNNLFQ